MNTILLVGVLGACFISGWTLPLLDEGLISHYCDFETDTCGYLVTTMPNNNKFKWKRNNPQPPLSSGYIDYPTTDHTLGTRYGSYMQITREWDFTRPLSTFETPLFNSARDGNCLNFWVYATGESTPLLNVYAKLSQNESKPLLLFAASDTFSRDWVQVELEIPSGESTSYQIVFEGRNELFGFGRVNLGIDDITIRRGVCRPTGPETTTTTPRPIYTTVSTTTTTRTTTTTTTPVPSTDGSYCDFETDVCGYLVTTNATNNKFKWKRSRPSPPFSSGYIEYPTSDHTLGSRDGYYFQLSREWDFERPVSSFQTPVFDPLIKGNCLTFWLFAPGQSAPLLNVYANVGGQRRLIYQMQDLNSLEWQRVELAIKTNNDKYSVTFEGVNQFFNFGHNILGIDDIQITNSCHH